MNGYCFIYKAPFANRISRIISIEHFRQVLISQIRLSTEKIMKSLLKKLLHPLTRSLLG